MVASRKRGNRTGKRGRRGKKDSFLIDGGRFFFLSGLLAILCVLLLFVTVLYGGGHDDGTSASGGSPLPQASDRPSASVPVATEPPLEIRPQEVISVSDLAVPPAREGCFIS